MKMEKHLEIPLKEEEIKNLKAGDYVYLTGTIYTARDAAHKRMAEALDKGEELPLEIKGATIYYMGPSPAREGRPIDPPVPPQPAGWISMLPGFWTWGWPA